MLKQFPRIIGALGFVLVFLFGVGADGVFNNTILIVSLIKGVIGGMFVWFIFSIVLDILFKSTLEDIPYNELDQLEGGLIQQISERQNSEKVKNVFKGTGQK